MTQTIYRLVKEKYRQQALSGDGSLVNNGRWHRAGARIIYAADAPSSALLEVLVNAKAPEVLQNSYVLFDITFERERHLVVLSDEMLPKEWKDVPWPKATQDLGMLWYTQQHSVILDVPSAVISRQRNFLININHPHFQELTIKGPEKFVVDQRLIDR